MPPAQKPKVGGDVQDLPLGARLVTGIQGRPVSTKAPTKNQALEWNGSQWVPTTLAAGLSSPLTTKGDIWGYSSVDARVPVGSDGNVLTADSTQALGVKWAAGSAGAMTRLFTSTLASAASTIDTTANGVGGGSSHLMVVLLLRGDTTAATVDLNLTFNNDTAAHYDYVWLRNNSGTVASVHGEAQTAADIGQAPAGNATASYATAINVFIPNYTSTTFFKQGNAQMGTEIVPATPTYNTLTSSFAWRSTAAITRMAITANAGNFVTGSTMTIYGLQ